MNDLVPPHTTALLRHFADLRDGNHGGEVSREDKERVFVDTVALLAPYAQQALAEINHHLLLDTGQVTATGIRRVDGIDAQWELSWPEQRAAGIEPITVRAFYGSGFHHPHLRGHSLGDWPLNVFTEEEAAAELPTLRAIVSAELHNLVFQRDYGIVPALMKGPAA